MQLESRKMLHVRMDTAFWRGAKGARECGPSTRTSKHHVHHAHHAHRACAVVRKYEASLVACFTVACSTHNPLMDFLLAQSSLRAAHGSLACYIDGASLLCIAPESTYIPYAYRVRLAVGIQASTLPHAADQRLRVAVSACAPPLATCVSCPAPAQEERSCSYSYTREPLP